MDIATEMKKSYEMYARRAEGYNRDERDTDKITLWANKYCEAIDSDNERNKNTYFSAIILKFWYKIGETYKKYGKVLNLDYYDCYNLLVNAIMECCEPDKRAWQKNPKLNAQQVINQVFFTHHLGIEMYKSTLQKNKAKYNVISLDAPIDGEDGKTTIGDTIAAEDTDNGETTVISMIQQMINNNHIVEAIIMDIIGFKDCYKHTKEIVKEINDDGEQYKYTKHSSEFWPFKVVKELNAIDENYIDEFLAKYEINHSILEKALLTLSSSNNQKKYKLLDKSLKTAREDLACYANN